VAVLLRRLYPGVIGWWMQKLAGGAALTLHVFD
jgi:hypothetical protein